MNAQFATIITARLAANLMQAVSIVLLAGAVPPSDIGLTSAIVGVSIVIFTVTDFGLITLIPTSYARSDHQTVASALHYNTLSTWIFGAAGLAIGLICASEKVFPFSLSLLILAVAVDRCVENRLGVPIAAARKLTPSVSVLIRRGAQLGLFITFTTVSFSPLWAYSIAQLLGALTGYLHSRFFLRRLVGKSHPRRPARDVFRQGLAFCVKNVSDQSQFLDSFLVSIFSGAHNAGLYAAAFKVTSPLAIVPGVLAGSVLPHAARTTPQHARRLGLQFLSVAVAALIFGAPIAFVVAEPVCVLLYGEPYRGAALPLTFLLVGSPFWILAGALSAILQAQGDERFVAKVGLGFALAFILAISLGSISGGTVGAAIGSSVVFVGLCIPLLHRLLGLTDVKAELDAPADDRPRMNPRTAGN